MAIGYCCPPKHNWVGRPKGSSNKIPSEVKQALLLAADQAGQAAHLERPFDGLVAYLEDIAERNPKLFLKLLGRVLPIELTGGLRALVQPRLQIRSEDS